MIKGALITTLSNLCGTVRDSNSEPNLITWKVSNTNLCVQKSTMDSKSLYSQHIYTTFIIYQKSCCGYRLIFISSWRFSRYEWCNLHQYTCITLHYQSLCRTAFIFYLQQVALVNGLDDRYCYYFLIIFTSHKK